jgi:hypothetical protein
VTIEGPQSGENLRWSLEPSHGKVEFRPIRPGVYTIADGNQEGQIFVANFFSAQESSLSAPPTAPAVAAPPSPENGDPNGNFAREYWRWAVAGVIVISLVEWWLFWKPRP